MKKLIILLIITSFSVGWAQKDHGKNQKRFSKKFDELEKIKLLETLNLDEETTLKFFARRNESKNKIESLRKEGNSNYKKLESEIDANRGYPNFGKLISRKYEIEKQIIDERANFIKSLGDILSNEQILKYVVFERKFKKNVRELLIEKGRKNFKKDKKN